MPLIVSILSIAGALFVYVLQKHKEVRQALLETKRQAYNNIATIFGTLSRSEGPDKEQLIEAKIKLGD
jgi:hypothetical protein